MQLLRAEKITKIYHSKTILKNLSFTINNGERIALIGRNGTGKSTLLKILNSNEIPDEGSIQISRNIVIGMLDQDILLSQTSDSPFISPELIELERRVRDVETELSFHKKDPPKFLLDTYAHLTAQHDALGGHHFEHEMKAALSGLGLNPEHVQTSTKTLSGGERMRIELARLLVQKPDLLLLDEPTNHLDDAALEWLETYLSDYSGAVVLVSHDRYFIDRTSSRIFELENCTINSYSGNYSAYYNQKKTEREYCERSIKKLEKELDHQRDVKQTMLSHRKMSSYHSREKRVDHLSAVIKKEKQRLGNNRINMRFSALKSTSTGDPNRVLFSIKSLQLAFDNKILFENASFYIKAQDKIFLCGPNGCGKTSLIKLLMGHIQNFEGEILYYGGAKIAYMGQFVSFQDETLSVFETLAFVSDALNQDIFGTLAQFGFTGTDIEKKVSVLSGGERSRLYLCTLLREKPDILILDEPTNHLDIISREILEEALCHYDGAIIAVSHDRFFIDKCATGILGFVGSRIIPFDFLSDYRSAFKVHLNNPEITNSRMLKKTSTQLNSDKQPKKKNRALERKENAKRKERLKHLEQCIHEIEDQIKETERTINAQTPPEAFTEYADKQDLLEKMLEEYFVISEEE